MTKDCTHTRDGIVGYFGQGSSVEQRVSAIEIEDLGFRAVGLEIVLRTDNGQRRSDVRRSYVIEYQMS